MSEKQILEPISSMARIIILNYKPIGTKVSLYKHKINIQEKTTYQGTVRLFYSQSREQISYLMDVILRLIYWYNDISYSKDTDDISESNSNNSNENIGDLDEFKDLLKYFIKGLQRLQLTYPNGNIYFALQYYINILDDFIDGNFKQKSIPEKYFEDWILRESYIKNDVLKKIWKKEDIILLKQYCDICFVHLNNESISDDKKNILLEGSINSISSLVDTTETEFNNILKQSIN